MEGVFHLRVKVRILAQYLEIGAVALSGIDEKRTISGISYAL
jgi:hypothetical protein